MNSTSILFLASLPVWLLISCKATAKPDTVTETKNTKLIYIGTYTQKEAHVDGKASGIYIYEMDMTTGALQYISTSPATVNPSFIDISHDGKRLYAVNETGGRATPGSISAFSLLDNGTRLEYINKVPSGGDYPCFVEVDKTGKYVLAANYGSGTIAFFSVDNTGALKGALTIDRHEGKGETDRQESAHAHSIFISPDNHFAYSCDLGTDKIYIYHLQADSGKLSPAGFYNAQKASGPRHLVFHPHKNIVYSINELNGTIECMNRDSISGNLSRFQIISTTNGEMANEAGCADIHITPSGNFLYATNRGNFNSLAMYLVDPSTGTLTLIGHQSVKGTTPRNFAIDPSGTFLLVANQNSDNVVTFKIDPKLGRLIDINVEAEVPTPVCIKFFPE